MSAPSPAVARNGCRFHGVARRTAALRRAGHRLIAARDAVTTLEYALMGLFIMVAIAGSVSGYGGSLGAYLANTFSSLASNM